MSRSTPAERAEHKRDDFVEGGRKRALRLSLRCLPTYSVANFSERFYTARHDALLHHEARLALRLLLQPPRFGRVPGRAQVRALELIIIIRRT